MPAGLPAHRAVPRVVSPTSTSSSIDELVAALEKEIVGGPHPAVVAGEQQADAFAARSRADLLEHELRETMKRVSQLEESEKTASALARSLKEQVAQLENRNISLQELHQSTNLERDSWSTERIRLDATIRDKERIIASTTADYHRDADNRQLVLGRCYELTAQVRQLSDAVAMGNTSAHQLLKRQLADKDNEIRRLLRTIRMSPVVSEFQRRSPFLVVAAMLVARSGTKRRHSPDSDADSSGSALMSGHASSRSSTSSRSRKKARATPTTSPVSSKKSSSRRSANKKAAKSRATVSHSPSEDSDDEAGLAPLRRPRQTAAANCNAIQRLLHAGESDSDSEVLGEAAAVSSSSGHGRQASSRSTTVSSTSAPPPSSQVTSSSPTPLRVQSSIWPQLMHRSRHLRWLRTWKHQRGVLAILTLMAAIRRGGGSAATPPNLSNKLVESSDSSRHESTLAGSSKPKSHAGSAVGSGSPLLASPTVAVRPPQVTTSAHVSAAAKVPVSSKTPPPARSPVRSATSTSKSSSASKAKAVVPARSAKDASKPKPASKAKSTAAIWSAKDGPSLNRRANRRRRCWEKIMSSCAVSVTMEKSADGERIKPTPCSISGLAAFMDVDDSGHPWRSVLRLLPDSLFFVDDSVLEVCPPVEKGKRSKKPGSLLEVLSHEWCKSRGVVREDILLALWERMHWIVESSVNVWLAEAFLANQPDRLRVHGAVEIPEGLPAWAEAAVLPLAPDCQGARRRCGGSGKPPDRRPTSSLGRHGGLLRPGTPVLPAGEPSRVPYDG
ncbi:unnamed protein product [Phytophthora fragariaefolia]|uniref:Unnamed protein product n=1 Tax=Phytophthora fragariaefolia TaxID=1490495 RepID=A0A9W6Y6L9_9STRA|nr:unnamed protein product [Phytophthora fragariaefolia]